MIALILAAIAAQATPSPAPLFAPPKGWTSDPLPTARPKQGLQYVAHYSNNGASFALTKTSSTGAALKDIVAHDVTNLHHRGYTIIASRAVTLCGQPGWYTLVKLPHRERYASQVIAANSDTEYIAGYFHSSKQESPEAHASLMSLCIPQDSPSALGPAPLQPPPNWAPRNLANALARNPGQKAWSWYSPYHNNVAQTIWAFVNTEGESSDGSEVENFVSFYVDHATLVSRKNTTSCGQVAAIESVYSGSRDGIAYTVQALTLLAHKTQAVALYMRRREEPADPAAVKALYSLCPDTM